MSWLVSPHLKRVPVENLYGRIGLSLLSVRVAAEGPSPCPAGPWHFQHSSFWKSSRPCRMHSIVTGGSAGITKTSPGFSLAQRGDQVLMKATRSARCCSVKGRHEGMLVLIKPRVMALWRSWSVGSVPVGVERHLKVASVKSRGLGSIHCAFIPLASPSGP